MTVSIKQNNNLVIGVAGGSGSGKTFFAERLFEYLGEEECSILYQDNYYHDQSHRFDFDGGSVNFDHPESIDFNLLSEHLQKLKSGHSVSVPSYDFKTHKRLPSTYQLRPKKFIILDGILILSQKSVREQLTHSVFVDTSESLRFERRLKRDVQERGRTEEGVRSQFLKQVKPMHDLFVEPSKSFASFLVHEGQDFDSQFRLFVSLL